MAGNDASMCAALSCSKSVRHVVMWPTHSTGYKQADTQESGFGLRFRVLVGISQLLTVTVMCSIALLSMGYV